MWHVYWAEVSLALVDVWMMAVNINGVARVRKIEEKKGRSNFVHAPALVNSYSR